MPKMSGSTRNSPARPPPKKKLGSNAAFETMPGSCEGCNASATCERRLPPQCTNHAFIDSRDYSLDRKMKILLVLLLTLNACQNPSRFQAAQPALDLSRH